MSSHEYRVRWTRPDWQATSIKSRTYQGLNAAQAFADRLYDDGAEVIGIDRRQVGAWTPTEPDKQ